jgi:protein arginine N-methyltransferase 2
MSKHYFDRKLTYTNDGRLLDENGMAIMMDWEEPIMKKSAEIITRNGGKILNVGFGMGFIDSFIEEHDIDEHWIIEGHIDVYTKMLNDGWHLKPHVKILYGDWRWYLKYLPKFDGIYFDTWDETQEDFDSYIPNILKENGIYSFFNNPRFDEHGLHTDPKQYEIFKKYGTIDYELINLPWIDDKERQNPHNDYYWDPEWKTYYIPIVKLKDNVKSTKPFGFKSSK